MSCRGQGEGTVDGGISVPVRVCVSDGGDGGISVPVRVCVSDGGGTCTTDPRQKLTSST